MALFVVALPGRSTPAGNPSGSMKHSIGANPNVSSNVGRALLVLGVQVGQRRVDLQIQLVDTGLLEQPAGCLLAHLHEPRQQRVVDLMDGGIPLDPPVVESVDQSVTGDVPELDRTVG